MKEVKIVRFSLDPQADNQNRGAGNGFENSLFSRLVCAEEELTHLVREGWELVTAGGTSAGIATPLGFVVSTREQ